MVKANRWLATLLALLLIAGCGTQPVAEQATATPAPPVTVATATPVQPVAAATATLLPDPSALCPTATEGTALYVSVENGFCFLYPAHLTLGLDQFRPDEVVHLVGAPADPHAMETVAVNLTVAYNGPADGLDSAQYADTWIELNAQGIGGDAPGIEPLQESTTIGGQPGVLIDDLPAMFSQRGLFIVVNGVKYLITLQPRPEAVAELTQEATEAWETVTGSLTFFPPQNTRTVVRPADVCPTATTDSTLWVNLVGGYCLLHPATFAPDPAFPVSIVGGPDLGAVEGFERVRASFTVGYYQLGEQNPEQLLQPMSDQIDPNSIMTTTINGYPAVVYDFIGGPWRQRNAQIVVDDMVYTFVAQPWDANLFPQALPDVEQVWRMASESIAFFDPWR